MNLFRNIFNKSESGIDCPRCLGKGNVDWDDIKRLNQELKWIPGACAYCKGKGKVDSKMVDKIPVEATYLVNSLPEEEKARFIKGDPSALQRAIEYDKNVDFFIHQICFLHFEAQLNSEQITRFFLLDAVSSDNVESRKLELMEYVDRVILLKKK